MMVTKRLFAALILGVGLYASDKTPVSDDSLADKVKLKLAQDTVVKGGGLTIDVKNGVVTLSGKVENSNQKAKAEKLTKKIAGVKGVNNQIVVTHAP